MKKHLLHFLCLSAAALSSSAVAMAQTSVQPAVLVCRAHQCADTSYSMTKGFLFNKIAQMFKNNTGKTVLLCEADPISHVCLSEGITIQSETTFTQPEIVIDNLTLLDEKLVSGETELDTVFDYRIRANNTYPNCQLSLTRLSVGNIDRVEMATQDTVCNITETGSTTLNATYSINYLDFDYGFIGAYYTIGVSEAVQGDKSGYVMMRFTQRVLQTEDDFPFEPDTSLVKAAAPTTEESAPALPAILQQTTPEISIQELLSQENGETTTETVVAQPVVQPEVKVEPTVELVPEPLVQEELPVEPVVETVVKTVEEEPVPTVIKTTIVEKTIITPDGERQVSPPEIRTLINGELKQ